MNFSKSIFFIFFLVNVSLASDLEWEKLPKLILFDLEYTLFPHQVDTFLVPPFHLGDAPGEVIDANGTVIKSYPEVPKVFKFLREHNISFGICASSAALEESKEIIKLFGWTRFFKTVEIHPVISEDNIVELSQKLNISLEEILAFDDEPYVHTMLRNLHVISLRVFDGMTMEVLKKGLDTFSNLRTSNRKMITSNVKFVICDFETSPMPDGGCLLLTGAMVNSLARYPPMRLQGRPYYIPKEGHVEKYSKRKHGHAVKFVTRLFNRKKKEDMLEFVLRHFYEAMCFSSGGEKPTLTISKITRYLSGYGQKPVVVLWNGSTDKYILEKLGIPGIVKFLSLSAKKSKIGNDSYDLLMKDMDQKNVVICSMNIGEVNKTHGAMLNLHECHDAICKDPHKNATYWHDPLTDVIYTRCIFWHMLKKFKPTPLYAYCNWKPDKRKT